MKCPICGEALFTKDLDTSSIRIWQCSFSQQTLNNNHFTVAFRGDEQNNYIMDYYDELNTRYTMHSTQGGTYIYDERQNSNRTALVKLNYFMPMDLNIGKIPNIIQRLLKLKAFS